MATEKHSESRAQMSISGKLTCNAGVAYLKDGNLTLLLDIRYPVTLTADAFLKKLTDRAGAAAF